MSRVGTMHREGRYFKSELSCEEREIADPENLFQNLCFKNKK